MAEQHHRRLAVLRLFRQLSGSRADVIVTPPSWTLRGTRWLVGLVGCLLCYVPYSLFVVPLIEPPAPRNLASTEGHALPYPEGDQSDLIALFGADAWELRQPMQLNTQWGSLLFQRYKRVKGRIELYPCTVLFRVPGTAGKDGGANRLIALQTPDRAQLNFDGDLDLMQAQMGKLKEAKLLGQVVIRSLATSAQANDALRIVTRDVLIEPAKIWTPHDVAFTYGASRGSGRVLTITLLGEDAAHRRDQAEGALVEDIEMLELVHVDALHLDFPGKGLLGDPRDTAARPDPSTPPASTTVDVTCQGSLQFDFQAGVLTLRDHVDVLRINEGGEDDRLRCSRLNIHFFLPARPDASGSQDPPVAAAAPVEPATAAPKMSVRRIEAMGPDVLLEAPSAEVVARGELLQYDFPTRRIVLQDPDKAMFAFRRHVTESPRMEYELSDDPQRLGKLWATGPGIYRGELGQKRDPLQALWQGTLELQPQGDLHVLSVVEGADFQSPTLGAFSADKLFVWLREAPAVAPPPAVAVQQATFLAPSDLPLAGPSPAASGGQAKEAKTRFEVVPVKMLAQGHVHANAEQFQGDFSQLEIWFDPDDSAGAGAPSLLPPAGDAGSVTGSDNAPPPPVPPGPEPVPQQTPEPEPETKRLELSGAQVRIRVRLAQPKPTVSEATVLGDVRLTQLSSVPGDPPPLLVTGDTLQLRVDPLQRAAIDVRGNETQKALVNAQGMLLEGSNLHVSQRENLMWTEGPGRMRLPGRKPKPADAAPAAPAAPPLAPESPIWISWQGGMDFDGQLIRFMNQVEVKGIFTTKKGEQLFMRSVGDKLHAKLNRYVEFSKTKKTDGLDVAELEFLGDVFTENQTFNAQNVLASQDRMRASDLKLDRTTGLFTGDGPGWITTTRVDDGSFRDRASGVTANPAAPRPAARSGQEELIYLRVDFRNAVQGNLDLKEAEFVNFVRTIYGPVLSWDQTLDPDQRGGLGPDGIVMTCSSLKIVEMGTAKQRALEMKAVGNVNVEGSRFSATADQITYVEAKDQLILEADGRNLVNLRQLNPLGGEPTLLQLKKLKYGVRSGLIDAEGGVNLQYNQIGTPNRLPPARIR